MSSNETTMIADNLSVNEIEDAVNLSIVRVIFYEKVAHHQLFSTEKFYQQVAKRINLSSIKYFNQRLLNYPQIFPSDCIFSAHSIMQKVKLNNSIIIALKK